jgi:hypothetical protein
MSNKTDKAKLAVGAEKIRIAQKEAGREKAPEPLVIPKSTRAIEDIMRERVTIHPDHIGLKIADATPIEESLRILDWATAMSDHVGFMIGDVINFGKAKWGEKYNAALIQTGRAYTTLRQYASVAERIPIEKRKSKLTFWQHELIVRTPEQIMPKLLAETAEQAEKGRAPTLKELRLKVQKLTSRKKKPFETDHER